MSRLLGLTVASCLLAGPVTLGAQTGQIRGVIRGRDENHLIGASITVLGTSFKADADNRGGFRLLDVPSGKHWILVRGIGYAPVRFTMTLAPGEIRNLRIDLEPLPAQLDEIEVMAETGMSGYRYQDFLSRSRTEFGKFLTRDDIGRFNPVDLVDVIRPFLPGTSRFGLEQRSGENGMFAAYPAATTAFGYQVDATPLGWFESQSENLQPFNRDCPPAISVNGGPVWTGAALVDFPIDIVEALEVYRRGSTLPIQFARSQGVKCGLVVIWLK